MPILIHVAIPCPLRREFDYWVNDSDTIIQAGMRVRVPFGSRQLIGVILSISVTPSKNEDQLSKLKYIDELLDFEPVIPADLLALTQWISDYYHHPIGDCFQVVLPKKIRQGEKAELQQETVWVLNPKHKNYTFGKKQQQIIDLLKTNLNGLSQTEINLKYGSSRTSLLGLEQKKVVNKQLVIKQPNTVVDDNVPFFLNDEQQEAVDTVWQSKDQFSVYLLQGITGSGKTEVYIQLAEQMLVAGKQVLILIPEIGLTSQFVERFKNRLAATIVVLNSSVSDRERKQSWLLAKQGLADVVIGTRSAVFTPLINLGLIVIDEEHDSSYKQQEGLRYHARNIALVRAKRVNIPIIMGSATPSIESLYHVEQQRYQLLILNQRATGATVPKINLIDSRGPKVDNGISSVLYKAIQTQLAAGNQVLLFINRRGFAPVLMCHDCGWQATCTHCDAKMIVHQKRNILCCHHCGFIERLPNQCPKCEANELNTYGVGTEQIEQNLQSYFPQTPILRIDRDTTQKVNAFSELVESIQQGGAKIIVGTQMLAKGHDFHNVTLVGVLDADQGLFSADFRATESLAQLIIQVTGRAGRGKKAGEVFIQTSDPNHIFWQDLINNGYPDTAKKILVERKMMAMPPAGSLCVIRAESQNKAIAMQFLTDVADLFHQKAQDTVIVMGPVPAIMEKRAGRYRAQILLSSQHRKSLHQLLDHTTDAVSTLKLSRKVRWSIDIDPLDLL